MKNLNKVSKEKLLLFMRLKIEQASFTLVNGIPKDFFMEMEFSKPIPSITLANSFKAPNIIMADKFTPMKFMKESSSLTSEMEKESDTLKILSIKASLIKLLFLAKETSKMETSTEEILSIILCIPLAKKETK
jgi:hypothetical protein